MNTSQYRQSFFPKTVGPWNISKISQQHIKDLGVTMSSDCSFYEHIDLKIKQCRQLTGWILRTFKARDKSTMLTLFKSLVLPRLEYGCQLWCPATVNQIRAM